MNKYIWDKLHKLMDLLNMDRWKNKWMKQRDNMQMSERIKEFMDGKMNKQWLNERMNK